MRRSAQGDAFADANSGVLVGSTRATVVQSALAIRTMKDPKHELIDRQLARKIPCSRAPYRQGLTELLVSSRSF
jgi:hypothetical protein